jgi:hypothetical protein
MAVKPGETRMEPAALLALNDLWPAFRPEDGRTLTHTKETDDK